MAIFGGIVGQETLLQETLVKCKQGCFFGGQGGGENLRDLM